jgi:hypothetical protein
MFATEEEKVEKIKQAFSKHLIKYKLSVFDIYYLIPLTIFKVNILDRLFTLKIGNKGFT